MKKKFISYLPIGMAFLCIITNPSVKDFKDYLGKSSYEDLHRTTNLFFFSVYNYDGYKYIGFFGNFFEDKSNIVYAQIPPKNDDSTANDSTRKIDYSSFDNALKASAKKK